MKKLRAGLVIGFLVCVHWAGAQVPVAMRVEIEPLRAVGDETLVAVTIQIAPEDRARIGKSAMVRTDLRHSDQPEQGRLWAVRVEADGTARVEVAWPTGEFDLKVELANPSAKDVGLWIGKVRIPDLNELGETVKSQPLVPTPLPESFAKPTPGNQESPDAVGAPVGAGGAVVIPTTIPRPDPPEPSPEPVVEKNEREEEAMVEAETSATSAPIPTPIPEIEEPPPAESIRAEEIHAEAPEPIPTPEVVLVPEEPEVAASPESEVSEAPVPLVEPLRAKPQPTTDKPIGEPPLQRSSEPEAVPADLAASYEDWEEAAAGTRDLTIVVTQNGDPSENLEIQDLRLQIGGAEVPIEAVGSSDTAPLWLGLAVDLSPSMASGRDHISRELASLTQRAIASRFFVAPTADDSGWGADPAHISRVSGTDTGRDIAGLISHSLSKFDGQRGRSFLLLITDGQNTSSKDAWKEAVEEAKTAGVPILVVALWGESFEQKVRKQLDRVTSGSGGRLFLVQGTSRLGGAVERYGRILDAGIAIRFQVPPALSDTPQTISVKSTDRTLQVRAPASIR